MMPPIRVEIVPDPDHDGMFTYRLRCPMLERISVVRIVRYREDSPEATRSVLLRLKKQIEHLGCDCALPPSVEALLGASR